MTDTDTVAQGGDRENLFVSNLPTSLVRRVRVAAAQNGIRLNELVEQALREYLSEEEPNA